MSNCPSINRFILMLRILVVVTIVMSLGQVVMAFLNDTPLILHIGDQVWSKTIASFNFPNRIAVFALIVSPSILWFLVLYQIWTLCSLYNRGLIFTQRNAICFKYIAFGMAGMPLLEALIVPLIGLYLSLQGLIPEMPNMNFAFFKTDLLTAGVFFWLIAKIMERATALREESELTV